MGALYFGRFVGSLVGELGLLLFVGNDGQTCTLSAVQLHFCGLTCAGSSAWGLLASGTPSRKELLDSSHAQS